jgi:hypothetical protein
MSHTQELQRSYHDPLYFIDKYVVELQDHQIDQLIAILENNRLVTMYAEPNDIALGYLLWEATMHPCKKILIASASVAAANELLATFKHLFYRLPEWLRPEVKNSTKKEFTFVNSSVVMAQFGRDSCGHGHSLSTVLLDDFAAWSPRNQTCLESLEFQSGKIIVQSAPSFELKTDDRFISRYDDAQAGVSNFAAVYVKEA